MILLLLCGDWGDGFGFVPQWAYAIKVSHSSTDSVGQPPPLRHGLSWILLSESVLDPDLNALRYLVGWRYGHYGTEVRQLIAGACRAAHRRSSRLHKKAVATGRSCTRC